MQTNRVNKIRATLALQGLSLRAWSLERDYNYRTVHAVVNRWADRKDRTPHGGIARQIMADINRWMDQHNNNRSLS